MKPMMQHSQQTLEDKLRSLAQLSREAYRTLAQSSNQQRSTALAEAAKALRLHAARVLAANAKDMQAAQQAGMSSAMLDRLKLSESRVEAMAAGLEAIAALPDPLARILAQWERPNGLSIARVSVPLGVIGIIYESRPNVTADAAGLCIKSGNACILRGGSDSFYSSEAIAECMHQGLEAAGLPQHAVQIVPTPEREAVGILLSMHGLIDVIVPRGGKSLTERVQRESRVPTLLHLDGNCHTYVHASADSAAGIPVIVNAKMRRTGVCGATESILVDRSVAATWVPAIAEALSELGCALRGDAAACALDARIASASEEDWATEYLDAIASIKIVEGVEDAVRHINQYGSHHTDAILAADQTAIELFCARVDSAIVVVNASTQFADGGEFGMGAEIGIATGRLHARGPVGAEQLTTYKYVVRGQGQIRP